MIGTALAKAFGVEATPQAVSDAIKQSDNQVAIEKIKAAVEELRSTNDTMARLFEADSRVLETSLREVNATMRVELLPENRHWFYTGWRPACGWTFVFMAICFGLLMLLATVAGVGGDAKPLTVMTNAWPVYLAYFGALAAVFGVNIWARSKDKETARK